jgi:hypothetical protein
VTYFVKKGIDINSFDNQGNNILFDYLTQFYATEEGVKFLIESGININYTCEEGNNALMWYFGQFVDDDDI